MILLFWKKFTHISQLNLTNQKFDYICFTFCSSASTLPIPIGFIIFFLTILKMKHRWVANKVHAQTTSIPPHKDFTVGELLANRQYYVTMKPILLRFLCNTFLSAQFTPSSNQLLVCQTTDSYLRASTATTYMNIYLYKRCASFLLSPYVYPFFYFIQIVF